MITARDVLDMQAKTAMAPMHLPSPAGFAPGMAAHALAPAAPAAGMGLHDKLDLAGLGILAAPAAYNLATGDKPSDTVTAGSELAGLGTLAGATMMRGAH
jgi:hypothetical protein